MDSHSNGKSQRVAPIAEALKWNMTDNCGIYRSEEKLQLGLQRIQELKADFKQARVMDPSRRFNTDVLMALETENLLTFSQVVVEGALARTESRGAHSRTDHPKRDDTDWLKHTMAHKGEDGAPVLSYKEVNIDWEKYPPQERKY
jgi:succinate dehydrogenase / fumarate reductase flavoprotein subunit